MKPLPIPDSISESWSINFIINLLVMKHLGCSYHCIYNVIDRLTKSVQIIPSFMVDDELRATYIS